MRKREEILKKLKDQGEQLPIPESLEPEKIQHRLEERKGGRRVRKKRMYPAIGAAACLCLMAGGLLSLYGADLAAPDEAMSVKWAVSGTFSPEAPEKIMEEKLDLPELTYGELYARLSETWEEEILQKNMTREEAAADEVSAEAMAELSASKESYGKTNVQTEQVDEGDQIKNDGRYLYQIACQVSEEVGNEENWGIQILDTQDGLQEVAFLDDFETVEEFYLWEDLLIAVERKYLEASATPLRAVKDLAISCKYAYESSYHEISIYNIEERTDPRKLRTFTLKGSYETSRISDGYFYSISRFTASPGEGEEDYEAYVPTLNGERMAADKIYCPEGAEGTSYLVLVSIDLQDPSAFADSRAVLAGNGFYYVSRRNIYMTQYRSVYQNQPSAEGKMSDKTTILKIAYRDGKFYAQAEGEIPGRLNDSFSLDEYEGYLRAVTTVQEYKAVQVTDDRTGEAIGYDYSDGKESNGLYVLDSRLSVKGKIEGLAGDEIVYSARFLGNTGYFVTFRQMDPLFAVDLSDPADPKVIGELKVSGFSEYLHFYGEDLLLGIGMEADAETGQQEGMKLSMFNLSNPAELTEEARLNLTDYNYSEALYNHRAVLIDTGENLIGLPAEGSNRGEYWQRYLVFSYEDGSFVKKLEADIKAEDGAYYRSRGTFIGDRFYLLSENGNVKVYDRENWRLIEELDKSSQKR